VNCSSCGAVLHGTYCSRCGVRASGDTSGPSLAGVFPHVRSLVTQGIDLTRIAQGLVFVVSAILLFTVPLLGVITALIFLLQALRDPDPGK
jgi:hypothetical protein